MRSLEFRFHPQKVKISAEEILADLNYPAGTPRRAPVREAERARRTPRR
ncbi:MAG: hypothetical protein ACRDL6_10510 [Solirubrobacterales bacterium]